jgi:hypothetical protein
MIYVCLHQFCRQHAWMPHARHEAGHACTWWSRTRRTYSSYWSTAIHRPVTHQQGRGVVLNSRTLRRRGRSAAICMNGWRVDERDTRQQGLCENVNCGYCEVNRNCARTTLKRPCTFQRERKQQHGRRTHLLYCFIFSMCSTLARSHKWLDMCYSIKLWTTEEQKYKSLHNWTKKQMKRHAFLLCWCTGTPTVFFCFRK